MRRIALTAALTVAVLAGSAPAIAHGTGAEGQRKGEVWREIAGAAAATARYHRVGKAIRDGYVPFAIPEDVGGTLLTVGGEEITCFDSASGGMGVHYVRNIDDVLSPNDPEALVYSIDENGRLELVALEYIIPEEFVDPADPPELFGQALHHHSYLPVYILHVWLWKRNPSGLFADFNPRVASCPAG